MQMARSADADILTEAINRMGAEIEAATLRQRGADRNETEFLLTGLHTWPVPAGTAKALWGFVQHEYARPFANDDVAQEAIGAKFPPEVIATMNAKHVFYGPPNIEARRALETFLTEISSEVERQIGHPWRISGVRAWNTLPTEAGAGPTEWHMDGRSHYLRKLMIYLRPPNDDNGTIEVFDRSGGSRSLKSEQPLCVLYDSAILRHRGRPAREGARPMIEITIMPATRTEVAYYYAGHASISPNEAPAHHVRFLEEKRWKGSGAQRASLPRRALSRLRRGLRKLASPTAAAPNISNAISCINVGGGPNFSAPGWLNLDAAAGSQNMFPFELTAQMVFPCASSSVSLVYSSHALEHLDDATVARVLAEARRVLAPGGKLLLKLPDFEAVLAAWHVGDDSYFANRWGLEDIVATWARKQVADTITTRAAMVFCGFWNSAYGDHFTGNKRVSPGASYHGPVPLSEADLRKLLSLPSPHAISTAMVAAVRDKESDITFNHQNAWSRAEIAALVERAGLRVLSTDSGKILTEYSDVPGIKEMRDISLYLLAVP